MAPMVSDIRLKIGEVAARSGISIKTIRYYEEMGLLTPTVERSDSGYRMFHPPVLQRLGFIKRAQSLGLSLQEIQTLLSVYDQGELPCLEAKQQLQTKVEAIANQIESLRSLQAELQELLNGWQEQPSEYRLRQTICPNIQTAPGEELGVILEHQKSPFVMSTPHKRVNRLERESGVR